MFYGWQHFRGLIDSDFGLSQTQLNERFFSMAQAPGEDGASFILRVEQQRRSIGASAETTLHCFRAKLDATWAAEVEGMRRTKLALNGSVMEWKDIVTLARDSKTHVRQPAPGGNTAPPPPAPASAHKLPVSSWQPKPATAACTTAPPPTTSAPAAPTAQMRPTRKCDYCTPLGIGMDTHDRRFCFVDPVSQSYKPDVRARRI